MRDFIAQRYNLLLCSTIIETGIDVPAANTIAISRADKFGLAQLHQLRGRVGRSHHQAYAYLMVPDTESLSKQAGQRLEAIQQMEQLGSGFYLAMHDLEIRGAGEVLGENQSGNILEIGFQLYNEMLAEAVRSLKAGKEPDLAQPLAVATEINLHSPALLPEEYCGDVHERLVLYKRLANCATTDEIDGMVEELVDRFGTPPETTRVLVESHRLRVLGEPLGVAKIDASPAGIVIQFVPRPPVEPQRIIALVQASRLYRLVGPERIRIEAKCEAMPQRVAEVKAFFKRLAGDPAGNKPAAAAA
jgi:transcription-repair coupling factor (superfamily II helicase)